MPIIKAKTFSFVLFAFSYYTMLALLFSITSI